MCSHFLADVQDVCDRIAILYQGELKVLGKVDELLKEQDVTQIQSSKLSPEAIQEVRAVLERHGAKNVQIDHPTSSLEDLFLKTVHESRERPGRRYVPDAAPVGAGVGTGSGAGNGRGA
jgi:ABC-2 type transport system ATP-binding protein